MALKYANDDGSGISDPNNRNTKSCWGRNGVNLDLTNYTKNNYCGTVSSQTLDVSESSSAYGYLPSNNSSMTTNFFDNPNNICIHDTDVYYYAQYVNICLPSPYLTDDSRNPMYYTTSATTLNALSDFNGKSNSEYVCELHNKYQNLSTATNIVISNYGTASKPLFPSVAMCYIYQTKGTNKGDWYLPSLGELGYIMPKFNQINNSLNKIKDIYGNDFALSFHLSAYIWSSTQQDASNVRVLDINNGSVNGAPKNGYNFTIPFLQV